MTIKPAMEIEDIVFDNERDKIIDFLSSNNQIIFKLQQRGDSDLSKNQKIEIALDLYVNNKVNFLMKFGSHLTKIQLDHFQQFADVDEEIDLVLKQLVEEEKDRSKNVKNRRYEALKKLIQEDEYFSDIEMMKRNPLLYEQLVGQYLTAEEIYERDKYKMEEGTTFVKILMEGIERKNADEVKKQQENMENSQEEEEEDEESDQSEDDIPIPSTSRWGEFEDSKITIPKHKPKSRSNITSEERKLLKEEFITLMYQSFLDGKDQDFDYTSVDNNSNYDNMSQINHDAEDKYFDSEDPETVEDSNQMEASSEDELDIYMSALNDHPAVKQLSVDMKRL